MAILNTVVPGVVWVRLISPEPNTILRVLLLFELNIPVVNVVSAKFNVPAVSVYVPVTPVLKAAPNVTVPDVCVNNGVVNVPPLYVNAVAVTKLVVVVRLCPLVIVTVPLTVYVEQVILIRFNVPAGANKLVSPVSELVQIKVLGTSKSIVPAVLVKVVQLIPLP